MRITRIGREPLEEIAYIRASRAGGVEEALLDILAVGVNRLPDGLGAIVVTADLQGYSTGRRSHPRLLGEEVAEKVGWLASEGRIGPSETVGVLLAGDYWAHPDLCRRGGAGDIRQVWSAFARHSRWVCGVAGNHDLFDSWFVNAADANAAKRRFGQQSGLHALDDAIVRLDTLLIAGLGGVIGNPTKAFRRSRSQFAEALTGLIQAQPDVLVCHEGFNSHGLDAEPALDQALSGAPDMVIVHGHRHGAPIGSLRTGHQVLNCCERVIVLLPERQLDER